MLARPRRPSRRRFGSARAARVDAPFRPSQRPIPSACPHLARSLPRVCTHADEFSPQYLANRRSQVADARLTRIAVQVAHLRDDELAGVLVEKVGHVAKDAGDLHSDLGVVSAPRRAVPPRADIYVAKPSAELLADAEGLGERPGRDDAVDGDVQALGGAMAAAAQEGGKRASGMSCGVRKYAPLSCVPGRVSSRSVRGYTVAASSAIQSARSTATLAESNNEDELGGDFSYVTVSSPSRRERGASSRAGARRPRCGGQERRGEPRTPRTVARRRLDAAQVVARALPGRF